MTYPRHILALALILPLAAVACGSPPAEEVESETVVPVTTAPARVGTIRAMLSVTGTVTPAPGAELVVVAPEAARIVEIPKGEGDRVRMGDVLVRFEIPALTTDTATRRAEVARAQARLQNAMAAQTRARDLFERGIAARKEVEDADRELADAQAGVAEAAATMAVSETVAARTIVRATFDGVVARRTHNPGDFVEPTASDPVLRIVDPRRLEITAAIPVSDVSRVVLGATAHTSDSTGSESATLKVVSRPSAVEPNTASAPVRLAFSRVSAAPVGARMQLTIDAEEHQNVVLVPTASIVHEGAETAVFVANGEKAERRVVTIGIESASDAEVLTGLKAGELVIVTGQAGLPDGASITVSRPEPDK